MPDSYGDVWRSLIVGQDVDRLAREAVDILGIPVPSAPFRAACYRAMKKARTLGVRGGEEDWSEGAWRSWLKNRAAEVGCYAPGCRGVSLADVPSCLLHIGFVRVVETDEQLVELRTIRNHEPVKLPGPARSRIGAANELIRPIDRVAGRVVRMEVIQHA